MVGAKKGWVVMVDNVIVYLRVNTPDSLISTVRANEHAFGRSPIFKDEQGNDVLGSTFEMFGRGDIGPTDSGLPVPYKSQHGQGDFWIMSVTVAGAETLLTLANPQGVLLGGARIISMEGGVIYGTPPEPREVVFGSV